MDGLSSLLTWLDYAAVAVFGATGALAAARSRHDIVTFAFFAAITGVGGGSLRDVLIDAPVFWIDQPQYVGVCIATAALVFVFGWGRRGERMLLWLDAVGTAAYAIVGALKAASLGAPPLTAVIMGVLTATFGGIIRDVLAGEPSALLRRELTITPALAGSAAFVALDAVGLELLPAGVIGFIVAFALRAGAILLGWQMPAFRGRGPDAP